MNIRSATVEDADALADLNAEVQLLHANAEPSFFKQPVKGIFTPKPVGEVLSDPNNFIYIAHQGDDAVGYIWAQLRERPDNAATYSQRSLHVEHISVKSDFHDRGWGTALMGRVKMLAKELDVSMITLSSWSFNTQAHAFFKSQRFEPFFISFRARVD